MNFGALLVHAVVMDHLCGSQRSPVQPDRAFLNYRGVLTRTNGQLPRLPTVLQLPVRCIVINMGGVTMPTEADVSRRNAGRQ